MTGSGIYGTLVEIDESTVVLQVAPGVELKVARRAVASKVIDPNAAASIADENATDEDSEA